MRTEDTHYAPAYTGPDLEPAELHSEILPGHSQGGTPHEDWMGPASRAVRPRDAELESRFDAVVTLFAWAQPCDWGVEELRYGFADADLVGADVERVIEAARWAHRRWKSGGTVLIRCQAGLNRSGLVTAPVLMLDGYSGPEAIAAVRAGRATIALFNDRFVDWLVGEAGQRLGLDRESVRLAEPMSWRPASPAA